MEWSPSNPDPNPIENLWSAAKMKLYEGSKQTNSRASHREVINTTLSEIEPDGVKK